MNGAAGMGSKSSPTSTLSPASVNSSLLLPVFVTRNSSASFVAPAATETVGLCSAIVTLTSSTTMTVEVFEVTISGVPPIE
jgi:hypothetical protein